MKRKNVEELREQVFKMVSVGYIGDNWSIGYDILGTLALFLNLLVAFLSTFDSFDAAWGKQFDFIEMVTVAFFALDYVLRLFSSKSLYPGKSTGKAAAMYIFSAVGIIDLLCFLPYYLPFFFPGGATAFRLFRVARIFRLFRINAYYDSLNVITEVIKGKRQQLLSSFFIIIVLMLASSLCMYSLEHEAQPDVFQNAFSGIWWSASTLLTVGYGDIYPVTFLGKIMGIFLTFLGVGMVAIPTGIISAGFVEQYTRLKRLGDYTKESDIHFIKVQLAPKDDWVGKKIKDLKLPHGTLIAMVERNHENVIPYGDMELMVKDKVVIGAEALKNDVPIHLKEMTLAKTHPWCGKYIRDLEFSRQTIMIRVRRHGRDLIPKGSLMLHEGDTILMCGKILDPDAESIEV